MNESRGEPSLSGGLPTGLATIDLDESICSPGRDLSVCIECDESTSLGSLQIELIDECGALVSQMSVESRNFGLHIPESILPGDYAVRLKSGDWFLDVVPIEIADDQTAELTQCLLKASLLQADALGAFELPEIDVGAIFGKASVAEHLYVRADGPRLAAATWQRVAIAFAARGMVVEAKEAASQLARLAALSTAENSIGTSSSAVDKDAVDRISDPGQQKPKSMTRIVVVTAGKSGVGKTTTSASFASGLALAGHKTAVIDFDVGLRNLDLIMGCERRVVYDLINVIQGQANLNEALIKDSQLNNLFILTASLTRDKNALTQEGVEKVLTDLSAMGFEYVVCDSPAGIEGAAMIAMHFADEAVVVTNSQISSVRDADRILGLLASKTKRAIGGNDPIKEHLLITRYSPNRVEGGQMLSVDDIKEILRIELIGVIPESDTVLDASNQGVPAVRMNGTDVSEAYKDVVARFLGESRPMRFTEAIKPSFFRRIFGGR